MSDAFVGEIRPFSFHFTPNGWLQCNGDMLPVSNYIALFSIIGFQFGGNGSTLFNLPDLGARAIASQGDGGNYSGLGQAVGSVWGESSVTLSPAEMPAHTHEAHSYGSKSGVSLINNPDHTVYLSLLRSNSDTYDLWSNQKSDGYFNKNMIGSTGGFEPHPNNQPYLSLNYCICYTGNYPHRQS